MSKRRKTGTKRRKIEKPPPVINPLASPILWRCLDLAKQSPEQITARWIQETVESPDACVVQCREMLSHMGSLQGDQVFARIVTANLCRRLYTSSLDLSICWRRTGARHCAFVAPFGMGDMAWVLMPVRVMSPAAKMCLSILIRGGHFSHDSLVSLHHRRTLSCFRLNDALVRYMNSKGIGARWMKTLLTAMAHEAATVAEISTQEITEYLVSVRDAGLDLDGFADAVTEVIRTCHEVV